MNIRRLAGFTAIAALTITVLSSQATAQGNGARSLEGVWDVALTNPPGVPAPARRLITYHSDGTVYDHAGGTEMPAQGVWEHVGGGVFEGVWWRFARDAAGEITAVIRVRSRIRVTSVDEYENEAKIDVFGPSGAVLTTFNASGRGRRIKIESFN